MKKIKKKPTLAQFHKKYPARPGDTVQGFIDYEEFCRRYPCPKGDGYHHWYGLLSIWVEALAFRDKNK